MSETADLSEWRLSISFPKWSMIVFVFFQSLNTVGASDDGFLDDSLNCWTYKSESKVEKLILNEH